MERRFQFDFSRVRVHTDARAAADTRALGARAYTLGSQLVFAPGAYAPEQPEGRRLLAHELTHVVQHGGADAPPGPLALAPPGQAAEREAERVADGFASDAPVRVRQTTAPSTIHRACLSEAECKKPNEDSLNPATVAALGTHATTPRYSVHFKRFVQRFSPELIGVPSAWVVSPGHPAPASAGGCPAFVKHDDPTADECIEVSDKMEDGAQEYLDDIYAESIDTGTSTGSLVPEEWKIYAERVANHESDHIPRRRIFRSLTQGIAQRTGLPAEEAAKIFGLLQEVSAVLAELPVEYDYRADFYEPGDEAVQPIRQILHGGGRYGYTLTGLMHDLCCKLPCDTVRSEVLRLVQDHSARWSGPRYLLLMKELEREAFCKGRVSLRLVAPPPTWPRTIGPPP